MESQPDEQASPSFHLPCMDSLTDRPSLTVPGDAWQIVRWEGSSPMDAATARRFLELIPDCFSLAGPVRTAFSQDLDEITLVVFHTRFQAEVHRSLAAFLGFQRFVERCLILPEQASFCLVSPIQTAPFDRPGLDAASDALMGVTSWWFTVSSISQPKAHAYREYLSKALNKRRYDRFVGYPLRLSRWNTNPGPFCHAMVPVILEAVWDQHPDLSVDMLTDGLSLTRLARAPREAFQDWVSALPQLLRHADIRSSASTIAQVMESIAGNPSLPYTQQSLARSLGLSSTYFCRLFHQETGQTFSSFLTGTRISHAQRLLREGGRSLQEIASLCGYDSKSYFCKAFRKYTGMTTSQFEERYCTPAVPDGGEMNGESVSPS